MTTKGTSSSAGVSATGSGVSESKRRPFRMQLGLALQRHRLKRGLTQAQLAEFADLSLKYVGEIERGEANTTLDAIERLAEAIGWDPLDALEGVREPITEGIRLLLLTEVHQTTERFRAMGQWLAALDPHRHPDARLKSGPTSDLASSQPPKRVRSRARPSGPRKRDETAT